MELVLLPRISKIKCFTTLTYFLNLHCLRRVGVVGGGGCRKSPKEMCQYACVCVSGSLKKKSKKEKPRSRKKLRNQERSKAEIKNRTMLK